MNRRQRQTGTDQQVLEDLDQPGVEQELEDDRLEIVRPFDPERIKVKTRSVLIESIVSRIAHDEIDLAPDFQRHSGIWNATRKARLIESLLLRIPLPVFYVASNADENWSVVDGLQRLTTINDYVNNAFGLTSLEYLLQFDGRTFDELPRAMQRRIRETELVVHVVEPGTPEEVMFNIFHRINTGGIRLNGQEIRHALHKGPARDYLKSLAELPEFLEATSHSVKPDRMADRECALRFLAFSITPWEEYRANDLDGFLNEAMRRINELSPAERSRLAKSFVRALSAAHAIFGADAFRKRYVEDAPRKPVSKALFEAWTVSLARCNDGDLERIVRRRERVKVAFMDLMNVDRAFDTSISYATGVPQRVRKRFEAIEDLIDQVGKP